MTWRSAATVTACSALAVSAAMITTSGPAFASPVAAARPWAAASTGVPVYAFNTGLVLTVSAKPARGTLVRVRANSGAGGQQWVTVGSTLRPAADKQLCLNVPDARYRSGARLQVWTCDGKPDERFASRAPSRHTSVFFLRPASRTQFCLTALSAPPNEAGSAVGLRSCGTLATQAWSHQNLDGVAGYLSDAWTVQATRPTVAGSRVTVTSARGDELDRYWISTSVGGANDSPVELRPVEDTAMCAGLAGAEADGAPLSLASCTSAAGQQFSGIYLLGTSTSWWSYLTTADSLYCIQAAPSGSASTRPLVTGACTGNNRDIWETDLDLTTQTSAQFEEIYAEDGAVILPLSVGGSGGAGSPVVVATDVQAATQVWTDLAPGQTQPPAGDPDMTLRPLADESLCLDVPAADYAAGVQLTVSACTGATDQEFTLIPPNLAATGAPDLCVSVPGGLTSGSAVLLEPCAGAADQYWYTLNGWYGWAGR